MPEFKKEWLEKAAIDYFAPFVNLWLACNSWYKSHYSDINGTDRDFINRIKSDFTGRNHLYTKFKNIIDNPSKEGIYFRANLELLHYSLERTQLRPEGGIQKCSFRNAVVNYNNHTQTIDLIKNPKKLKMSPLPFLLYAQFLFFSPRMVELRQGNLKS